MKGRRIWVWLGVGVVALMIAIVIVVIAVDKGDDGARKVQIEE